MLVKTSDMTRWDRHQGERMSKKQVNGFMHQSVY